MNEVEEARRFAAYMGHCARKLYGTPAYQEAKRAWLRAVDDWNRLRRKEAAILEARRAECENNWRGR